MKTVKQVLQAKGSEVWSVTPETSIFDALKLMADKDIGALVVIEGDRIAGIVSERDYARKVVLHGKTSQATPVSEIMTPKVFFVRPDETIDDCMALMTQRRIRHLPVLQGDQLVGVTSIGDVVKAIIEEQQFMIDQLEHYITTG